MRHPCVKVTGERRITSLRKCASMRLSGKNLLTKMLVWLAAEILLTSLGTDDLADYSEFIFEMNFVKIEIERRLALPV